MFKASLPKLLGALHDTLANELGIARDVIAHPGTKGDITESQWLTMLQHHLPLRYRATRAFVIDSKDVCSEQIDIVIHDRQYSPFVLNYRSAEYVPAESVYAVFEVKQELSADYIAYAAQKVASVRSLHRTSLPIPHAGGTYPAKPLHHIVGGILALESAWSPPLGASLNDALASVSDAGRLDLACAVRHGLVEIDWAPGEGPAITCRMSNRSLALFVLRLIARLQMIATVPCMDVLAYASSLESACSEQ